MRCNAAHHADRTAAPPPRCQYVRTQLRRLYHARFARVWDHSAANLLIEGVVALHYSLRAAPSLPDMCVYNQSSGGFFVGDLGWRLVTGVYKISFSLWIK